MEILSNKANRERLYFFIFIVSLFLFACWVITFYYKDFFASASENSLFLPSRLFFVQTMQKAGGLLSYGGLFFTQFFYYPLFGSVIFLLLLLVVAFLVIKVYEFPFKIYPLAFIPVLALIVSITETGYLIYSLKSPGYLFSNILGIIVSLLFCWGYKIINVKHRLIHYFIPIIIISSYPLFGFYSLFAAFMCFLLALIKRIPLKIQIALFFVYLLTGFFIPWLFSRFVYTEISWNETFTAGLPKFYYNLKELHLWIPFIILFISLSSFFLFLKTAKNNLQVNTSIFFSYGIMIALIAGAYFLSYRDSNFMTELKMLQSIEKNDWAQVVSIREKQNEKPTRLIVMFNNLALYKSGLAGDRMFTMENNSVLHNQSRNNSMIMIKYGAKPLYFQYGLINYCYRWCMEDMVEYGMTVQGLKYMVKCALMNGELALANKYNAVLGQTLFHKQWADKYQKYIDNSQLIEEDAEFKAILPLKAYQNRMDKDNYLLEYYILNHFATMRGGPPELVELSIQCNLIIKNVARFWPRFFQYVNTHDRIPVHYQEAALIYSFLEGNVDISHIKFDDEIVANFENLVSMSKEYAEMTDEYNKNIFKPLFGKTFWYYYFFITVTTN